MNPFKYGTIVDGEYFTDREQETQYILQQIDSPNHLILVIRTDEYQLENPFFSRWVREHMV